MMKRRKDSAEEDTLVKRGATAIILAALAVILFPACLKAQTIRIGMPVGLDPIKLIFQEAGKLYTDTNDPSPNVVNGPITGLTFDDPRLNPGGIGGLEIHGAIPNPAPVGGFIPVTEIAFYSLDYSPPLTLLSYVNQNILDPVTGKPFLPWLTYDSRAREGIYLFLFQPGAAPLNKGQYFGLIDSDTQNPPAFNQARFGLIANPTPEPGALALIGGLLAAGGLLLRKRGYRV